MSLKLKQVIAVVSNFLIAVGIAFSANYYFDENIRLSVGFGIITTIILVMAVAVCTIQSKEEAYYASAEELMLQKERAKKEEFVVMTKRMLEAVENGKIEDYKTWNDLRSEI